MEIDLAEMVKRTRRIQRSEFIAPPLQAPSALGSTLLTLYMRVVRQWGRELPERVMPAYRRTVQEPALRDSGDVLVVDTVDEVGDELEGVAATLSRLVLTLNANLEDWVVRVEEWHRGRFAQLFTPAGVRLDTLLGRGEVAPTLQAVLEENVALIRSLNEQMRNGISGAVFRGLTNRSPAAEVAREIRKITAIGRRRAELIAADQLQKLTGRLDQERQQQVGIRKFQWAHSRKKHPRAHHVARDGQIFSWKSHVAKTDPPGRAIRCGCRARAVVELK